VDRYTRAGFYGKKIVCPECGNVATVYHFSWSALSCQECGAMVEKNQWTIK
jgi:ribosomal protein S27E